MSKKQKPKPQSAAAKQPIQGAPVNVAAVERPSTKPTSPSPVKPTRSPEHATTSLKETSATDTRLIRFDKRVKWFLSICAGLFLILTLLKIHGSSVSAWNQIIPDGSDARRGLISGKPKMIRVDEYGVLSPYMLSQAANGFELENESIGGGSVPMVLGVPVKHFITIFRPHFWGFFILDLERGFAWWWNFKVFGILISATLLFLVLTRNNFWLSVFGGVWLLLSSGTIWWFSTGLTEMIIGACLVPTTVIYLLYGQSNRQILIAAALTAYASLYFASHLYPPYQVPLAYLMGFLLIGYVLSQPRNDLFTQFPIKAAGVVTALGLIGVIGFLYYQDAKPTLDLMLNTAYPGKRVDFGGTGFASTLFAEYVNSFYLTDQRFPKNWLNSCELSHYLCFAPLILLWLPYQWSQEKKVNYTLAGVALFVIFGWIWITIGFPEGLSKLTLMSTSPTRRAQIPFGVGNVVLAVLFLNSARNLSANHITVLRVLAIAGAIGVVVVAASQLNNSAPSFFRTDQLLVAGLYFGILNALMLPVWGFSYRVAAICLGILIALLPNLGVNPVAKGLSPITENALYRTISSIRQQDPDARWVVFGNNYITYLVEATGVKQISGVKYTPNFKIMRSLDPKAVYDTVYNRYAHSVYFSMPNQQDTVIMGNGGSYDAYGVNIDPCSAKLKKLNVRYVLFEQVKQPADTRCMTLVSELGSLKIYKIND